MLARPGCHAGDLVFLCQRLPDSGKAALPPHPSDLLREGASQAVPR